MDDDGGILNIEISDNEDDQKRADRTGQTEAAFQAVKRDYRAKIYKSIKLPLGPGANKQHLQEVVHAVEELYFFRRYQEALDFLATVQNDESAKAFDNDTRKLLDTYGENCLQKLNSS
ncbi:hypothetical protein TOPH_09031 [Tolypocladium ophioglossoides CBS 100239]|uniref:Uncharacterized protein n=1 Tax=Tolypocladium ophioglossoides (strain CBS 100239) TaxID=1163406 RepID=A0A0L0MX43_TOLOC|nr:hypothetical protein TOPH_09031 [Tolypocladium ophioglossoides CBS 100239]